ncbi:hypothetical protein B5C34_03930 [Pacificimonas flava]|uniref:Shikimate dehydrogenase (NADP(+)) n=2 Tax=Pacificimonas TaxID=1960290 RepID=A0A219B2W7_9SPHN|nr:MULTISPECIES: shikimate dehydrogenase [Pacificimonas]MBZ6377633.1 shikimate dehydrogenase [Pacificimonas aurantium]OWV32680.1 hypothetical protein B5C34_03930 [Pacificimonas flava]
MNWRELPPAGRPYAEVIGDPISHSKSPDIHGFWLERLGIDAAYRHAHVPAEDLEAYFDARRKDPEWRGCNATLPHKLAALRLADRRSAGAEAVGAANCIMPAGDGALLSDNSDVGGFLEPLGRDNLVGKRAAVIGAGGAARAVVYALANRGADRITVLNRTPAKARALVDELAPGRGDAAGIDAGLVPADLLVNASSLGMTGQAPLKLDLSPLLPGATVYDIVYAPLDTALLQDARARGLVTIDGLSMLIGQARSAFSMFFGREPAMTDDKLLRQRLTA